jgi:hypothetical protein
MSAQVALAAYNNAHWCDTICCAHGIPGEFQEHLWLNRHSVPRFYPNVVTLSATPGAADQLAAVGALVDIDPTHTFIRRQRQLFDARPYSAGFSTSI